MAERGMTCDVLRPADGVDCTLGGVSSRSDQVFVLGIDGWEDVETATHCGLPVLKIDRMPDGYVRVRPEQGGPWMFGGNFVYSSDSRFRRVNPYPIPIHDRKEYEIGSTGSRFRRVNPYPIPIHDRKE